MTDTFRALCAELHAAFNTYAVDECHHALLERTRAALADKPAVPEGREPASVTGRPSDEEFLDLLPQGIESGFWLPKGLPSDWVDGDFIAPPKAIIDFARDVLELWGNPAPPPPADGEVAEVMGLFRHWAEAYPDSVTVDPYWLTRAAELLQRLNPPQPVPVSERLPEPSDCAPWPDEPAASAWCWVGSDVDGGWSWEQRSAGCLAAFPDDFTHWLPAHALPLPEVGE